MNKLLTILAALLIAATGCASPPAVNDVKVTQAVKVSPPTWDFHIFSPVANSLWGFDSSVLPVNVTLGSGLTLNATTHVLTAGVGSYQPINAKLTAISGLANGAGWLHNDGAGVFVYSTPTKTDVSLGNVDNTSDATKNAASVTLTNKTLTAPVINLPTGIVKADVGLGNVDNTSDATKNSAVATLTNKTIADSQLTGTYTASGQTMTTSRLLGRVTAGTGAAEEISLGTGLAFVGSTLTQTSSSGGTVTNTGGALTNNAVVLGAGGNDTKVISVIKTDGVSGFVGTATNNNAQAGSVGEYVESIITSVSAVSLSNATGVNITSISLTAGDWDVGANFRLSNMANVTFVYAQITTTSATIDAFGPDTFASLGPGTGDFGASVSTKRYSLSGTTTIYLATFDYFSAGTCGAYGTLRARRVR